MWPKGAVLDTCPCYSTLHAVPLVVIGVQLSNIAVVRVGPESGGFGCRSVCARQLVCGDVFHHRRRASRLSVFFLGSSYNHPRNTQVGMCSTEVVSPLHFALVPTRGHTGVSVRSLQDELPFGDLTSRQCAVRVEEKVHSNGCTQQ